MSRVSRTHLVLALLLIGSVVFLAVTLRGPRPAHRNARNISLSSESAAASTIKTPRKLRPAAPSDVDFRRYAALASSPIFGALLPPPIPPKPILNLPPPIPVPPPAPRLDLTGWAYAGTVTLQSKELGVMKLGIVQNEAAGSVEYLAVGDSFLGATAQSVTEDSITFDMVGSVTTLSRPKEFSLSPLSAAAGGPAAPQGARGR